MPALITWWKLDVAELSPRAHSDAVSAIGADLLARLAEPHRKYHSTHHLVEMFWALEELEEAGEIDAREGAVGRIAAWFHDAVYDVARSGENEALSAELARKSLKSLAFGYQDTARVDRLVLATQEHTVLTEDRLAKAFNDADLWILSAPEARFDEYCGQVRGEYASVSAEVYARARIAILEDFLRRDMIYATATAQQNWEDRARDNVSREIRRLAG